MLFRMMAQVPKTDPLPYARTFQVDSYAVVKVHFWPNQQHGLHAAIITNHGCWIADLASNPGSKPSESSSSEYLCLSCRMYTCDILMMTYKCTFMMT